MEVHEWNLPFDDGGWDVNWKHELEAQKKRAQVKWKEYVTLQTFKHLKICLFPS
jgi:hypothetical protein